ncbi:MAG: hypothetical protein KJ970_09250 [Candidatus Eisenbacteria bacterium]|uniref:Uncharacterized protein n=1 Tax=Eiseniibacteriota bacterium TaxID=2212470 RepID=A0A948W638_UNCEI|nr:hypothetical protein [Candidatus Eisenbacteria bacterium]MBU1950837.1 hypothetical protein [Candidatus Eisenbacteria bacterium]MBU2691104.1 hypothetical protein [Candidatus Eisenbacteria bacterium]
MDFLENPEEMMPEQRLRELAAILAAGFIRLRNRNPELASTPDQSAASTEKPLDVSGHPSSCLDNGLTGRDPVQEEVPE